MFRIKCSFVLMLFVYCMGLLIGYWVFKYVNVQLLLEDNSPFGIENFLPSKETLLQDIIVHNFAISMKMILLGCFSLGVLGGCILFYNGVVHGFCFSVSLQSLGLVGFASHLLPHSLELLGLIMSAHLGLLLSYKILLSKPLNTYGDFLKYGIVIFVILFVSSILEVYVSID